MPAKESDIEWGNFFYYDGDSPSGLRWKVPRYHGKNMSKVFRKVGDRVGACTEGKGWRVKFGPRHYFLSRVIFELCNNLRLRASDVVDHIDGNKLNNNLDNLRVVTTPINNRNLKKSVDNTSGVVGVNRQKDRSGNYHWVSTTYNLDGTRLRKCFSENKYGEEMALKLACDFRENAIKNLNTEGAGYSERHGN